MARHQLDDARRMGGSEPTPGVRARIAVRDAEVAFAADDPEGARLLAEGVVDLDGVTPDVCCHALEVIGRCHRLRDIGSARSAVECSLVTAQTADPSLWRAGGPAS